MNKRAKILRRVNRQFAPGLPEWLVIILKIVGVAVGTVAAYWLIAMILCM